MYELVVLPSAFGLRNVSPFCLKIEMLMTALELDHSLREEPDPRRTPKGKLPYLIHDGRTIADSELIAVHLDAVTDGGVFRHLTDARYAQGIALTRLLEDHLYWIMVASRWLDDAWFPNVVRDFFGFVPALMRPIASGLARRSVRQTFHLQGLGRHSLDEQRDFAHRDMRALQAALPTEGFLNGEHPDIFDFTVAGMMAGILDQQPRTWINAVTDDYPAVRDYTERVQAAVNVWARK